MSSNDLNVSFSLNQIHNMIYIGIDLELSNSQLPIAESPIPAGIDPNAHPDGSVQIIFNVPRHAIVLVVQQNAESTVEELLQGARITSDKGRSNPEVPPGLTEKETNYRMHAAPTAPTVSTLNRVSLYNKEFEMLHFIVKICHRALNSAKNWREKNENDSKFVCALEQAIKWRKRRTEDAERQCEPNKVSAFPMICLRYYRKTCKNSKKCKFSHSPADALKFCHVIQSDYKEHVWPRGSML